MHTTNRGGQHWRRLVGFCLVTCLGAFCPQAEAADEQSRFSDEPAPLRLEGFPERPPPLLELGDRFLGAGDIKPAFELPTGAVWHPAFWMYGTFRSAVQSFDPGDADRISEWKNRLDLFGNLQLAATERILVGIRPLDRDGRFTGYDFEPHSRRGWREDFSENSLHVRTLFFEGEFGEIFPKLDRADRHSMDYGISFGRQPLLLQDGILVNDDSVDMLSITRNALLPPGTSTMRLSGIFAWNEIGRNNNLEDNDALLFGLNTAIDFHKSTVEGDLIYIVSDDGSDGFYAGLGSSQRFGRINTVFRVAHSVAVERESARVRNGTLLFAETSYTPTWGHDLVYANAFWGIDDFSSAVRGPDAGGPLGRTGLLFAAVGLGQYGAALGNRAERAVGGAIGYQMYFGELRRRQLVGEIGARTGTDGGPSAEAVALRYQQAFGRRYVLVLDAFGALREDSKESYGGRIEMLVKF